MSFPSFGLARALAAVATLAACNSLTGAGEPEIVAGEGGASGSTLSTTASTAASTTTSSGTSAGGSTSSGVSGVGGHDDADDGTPPGPGCGDGVLGGEPEECDDGNTEAGDGCNGACKLECANLEVPRASTATCVYLSPEDDDRSWEDARTACQGRGGDLLVLHHVDLGLLSGRVDDGTLVHIGATRAEDGEFEWIDGETVDEGEVVDDEGADCLAIGQVDLDLADWLFVAVPCTERLRFLCEQDPTASAD